MVPIDPATDCDNVKGVTRTAILSAGSVNKALSTFVFPDATAEGDES